MASATSKALQRLTKEKAKKWPKIVNGHCEQPDEADPYTWNLWVYGPEKYEVDGTERPCPYAGKQFKVILKYPTDYPFNGPEMKFETGKLLHPNVNNDTGEMCMEGIEGADLTVDKRAAHIVGFLAKPNVGNPQDDGTATMMMDKIEEYEAKAKEWAAKAPDAPSA